MSRARSLRPLGALLAMAVMGCPSPHHGTGGAMAAAWTTVFDDGALNRAVLSIWGTSSKSVYAVGGPLGNGGETLVLHYDGTGWKDLHPGGTETFWWLSGTGDADVWMVGENGRIAHYDGASFTAFSSGTTSTIWGVVALAKNDAWAVGGVPEGAPTADEDIVLHFDGTSWTREALPNPTHKSFFKVWGTADDDLYVVGEAGVIWHRGAAGWVLESNPPVAMGTLFTVTGCGSGGVYAVGGSSLLKSDGKGGWTAVSVSLTNGGNGVACTASGGVAVVGFGGLKERLEKGAWIDDFTSPPHGDLHAVWADERGDYWAVGGDFLSKPTAGAPRNGTIAHFGSDSISATLK